MRTMPFSFALAAACLAAIAAEAKKRAPRTVPLCDFLERATSAGPGFASLRTGKPRVIPDASAWAPALLPEEAGSAVVLRTATGGSTFSASYALPGESCAKVAERFAELVRRTTACLGEGWVAKQTLSPDAGAQPSLPYRVDYLRPGRARVRVLRYSPDANSEHCSLDLSVEYLAQPRP